MEHETSPRGRGAVPPEDLEGPEAGVPGPLPHPLALRLPVSATMLQDAPQIPMSLFQKIMQFPLPSLCRQGDVPFPRKEDGALLYDDIDYKLTWYAMEKLVEKGLVRSIGLSNFNSQQIDDVLSVSSIKPTVLQV